MPTDSKESDFPPLQGIEDYLRWAQHAEAKLQSQNCQIAISPTEEPITRDTAIAHFLSVGYDRDSIRTATTMEWVEKKLNKREEQNTKAIGILKKLIKTKNQQAIEGKSARKIWITLKAKFKDVSPMNQVDLVRKACLIHMSNFTNASSYCHAYEAALDQICGMLQLDSVLNRLAVEAILQRSMLANVSEKYKLLVAQLRESWTSINIDLSKTCLSIERYDFATNGNPLDANTSNKTLLTSTVTHRSQAPKGSCDFEECVRLG